MVGHQSGSSSQSQAIFVSCNGEKPLSWAAACGHDAVMKLLLEKGADLGSKANDGRTPLSWATEDGYEALVKLLL